MNLETRIAALKTALAEKHEAEIFKENPDGFTCAPYCNGDFLSSAFEKGAEALGGGEEKKACPPHSWDQSGERCTKCGDKDWMT